jgi:hypothetical protein
MQMDGILHGLHVVEIMLLQIFLILDQGFTLRAVMYSYTDSLGVTLSK